MPSPIGIFSAFRLDGGGHYGLRVVKKYPINNASVRERRTSFDEHVKCLIHSYLAFLFAIKSSTTHNSKTLVYNTVIIIYSLHTQK